MEIYHYMKRLAAIFLLLIFCLQSCKAPVKFNNEDVKEFDEVQDQCVFMGDLELVKNMLDLGYNSTRVNLTPLRLAGIQDYPELVKLLLKRGLNPNLAGENGISLLHWAAYWGHLDIVSLLLEKGANVNITDQDGYTPLQLAAERGNIAISIFLLAHGANPNIFSRITCSPLHWAIYDGNIELVNLLLKKGAQLHVLEGKDTQPLNLAIELGHVEIVKLLLAQGTDPNNFAINVYTALHSAVTHGNLEIINLLLDKGAELNFIDVNGFTPIHLAIRLGQLEVIRLFLCKGLDPNLLDGELSLLNWAIYYGHLGIADLLLERGANPNKALENGYTSLHWAAYNGNLELVNLLLERGVDCTLTDHKGRTALHIAACRGHMPVIFRLLLCNLDINAQNDYGQTFLHDLVSDSSLSTQDLLHRFTEVMQGIEKNQGVLLDNITELMQDYCPELTNEDGKSIFAMVIDYMQGVDVTLEDQNAASIIAIIHSLLGTATHNQEHEEEVIKILDRHKKLGGWVRSSIQHKRKADTTAQRAPASKKHRPAYKG